MLARRQSRAIGPDTAATSKVVPLSCGRVAAWSSGPDVNDRARPTSNQVVAYDPTWPAQYDGIAHHLVTVLAGVNATIEHVGSTAVPGMPAKPIIDVDIVVLSARDTRGVIDTLSAAGYAHRGDLGIDGREAFDIPPELPYFHLYAVVQGSKPHLDHVLLRDYLIANPDAARRYAARKLAVAPLIDADGREAYQDAKTPVIEELLEAARVERGQAT